MPSLRTKITLSMLVTSLASALVVGAVARTIVLQRFGDIALQQAFDLFQGDVTAYIDEYGSWNAGTLSEPFGTFVARRGAEGRPGGPAPGASPDGPPPAPFAFLLLSPDGRVLLGPPEYPVGTTVDGTVRAQGLPITANNDVVAVAVPIDNPNLTVFDSGYLAATRDAVAYGVGVAALVALAVGFFFSDRLSRSMRRLSSAIDAMGRGELRQRVDVRSGDEIGALAGAFNQMSEELAASHDRIRSQALLLKELSIRDELTGLHNRRHFDEQAATLFAQAVRYKQPLTVMMCDLDRFKQINDQFSHATGDVVLRHVAEIPHSDTRASDVVARYGGEEFVILFPQSRVSDIVALCEQIRADVEYHNWDAVAGGLRVTLSIGIDDDVERGSIGAMLAAADARLYQAKAEGRNRVVSQ